MYVINITVVAVCFFRKLETEESTGPDNKVLKLLNRVRKYLFPFERSKLCK